MQLLLVDPDTHSRYPIEQGLSSLGYRLDCVSDADRAAMLATIHRYEAILVTVEPGSRTVTQTVARIRRELPRIPIIVLASQDAVDETVRALDAGADDYLAKPIRHGELVTRVHLWARRVNARRRILRFGPLELDRYRHQATLCGRPLDLNIRELRLLDCLLEHPEEPLTRSMLIKHMRLAESDTQANVLPPHIADLRRKLAPAANDVCIDAVRGIGYCLRRPEAMVARGPLSELDEAVARSA